MIKIKEVLRWFMAIFIAIFGTLGITTFLDKIVLYLIGISMCG